MKLNSLKFFKPVPIAVLALALFICHSLFIESNTMASVTNPNPQANKITGIVVWKTTPDGPRILIPLTGRYPTPETAIHAYITGLEKNYTNILDNALFPTAGNFLASPLVVNPSDNNIVILSNSPLQLLGGQETNPYVRQHLDDSGAQTYLVPLGLDSILRKKEIEVFQKFILKHFDGMVVMGGDDVHPDLYARKMAGSLRTNLKRDQIEKSFIKSWLDKGKGSFLGICRGHQIAHVTLGHELYQDIDSCKRDLLLKPTPTKHSSITVQLPNNTTVKKSSWHKIELSKNSLLYKPLRPCFQKRKTGKSLVVNSRHHQAVKLKDPVSTSIIRSIFLNILCF
jgi:gamma-glutamyl-gamma-aminobutyrate hydrolase PuuD